MIRVLIGIPASLMALSLLLVLLLLLFDFPPWPSANNLSLAWPFLVRAFVFALVTASGQVCLGLLAALSVLWLARTKKSQLALITVFLIPYAIPASVIGLAFRFAIGPQSAWAQFTSPLLGVPPNFWLYQHAFEAAVLASTWQFFPFAFLLSYLGLRTTPRAVLQAAQMDGAPFTRTTLMVVLARILPVIMAIFALRLAFMLVKFDTPFVFTEMIASGDDVATIELWRTIAGSTSPELNIIAWCLQITSFLLSLGYLAARREGAD